MAKIDEIRKLNNDILLLRDELSELYNEVNHPMWPVNASLKKKRKKYFWGTVFSLCIMFCVVLWILLFEIVNEYWIGASIGLASAIIIYFVVRLIIVFVKYKRHKEEWDKALVIPNQKNNELNELYKQAVKEMYEYLINELKDNQEEIDNLKSLGDDYEDVYQYYQDYIAQNS